MLTAVALQGAALPKKGGPFPNFCDEDVPAGFIAQGATPVQVAGGLTLDVGSRAVGGGIDPRERRLLADDFVGGLHCPIADFRERSDGTTTPPLLSSMRMRVELVTVVAFWSPKVAPLPFTIEVVVVIVAVEDFVGR